MIGALILSLLFGMVSAHDGPGPVIALALGAVFAGVASVLCIKRQRAERRSAAPAR